MKSLILNLMAVFSLVSSPVFASTSANMAADQKIEQLQQEVQILRQIILNSQAQNKPMCVSTGERCYDANDICCNSGRYCGMAGGICP